MKSWKASLTCWLDYWTSEDIDFKHKLNLFEGGTIFQKQFRTLLLLLFQLDIIRIETRMERSPLNDWQYFKPISFFLFHSFISLFALHFSTLSFWRIHFFFAFHLHITFFIQLYFFLFLVETIVFLLLQHFDKEIHFYSHIFSFSTSISILFPIFFVCHLFLYKVHLHFSPFDFPISAYPSLFYFLTQIVHD